MSVTQNLSELKKTIPDHVTLIAVSKTKPIPLIQEAYDFGHRDFGENKVQELVQKREALPKDIRWHMIGHLQTNKVKYILPFIHLIHGVDSLKLLKEINKRSNNINRVTSVLLQIHVAEEGTKFGFDYKEILDLVAEDYFVNFNKISIKGFMGMATNTEDENKIRREFRQLSNFFNEMKPHFSNEFDTLSMGMSGDYNIAMEEASTMVRVGSKVFGARNYS